MDNNLRSVFSYRPGDTPEKKMKDFKFHLEKLVNVPRVFLPTVLKGCVKWAEENNVKVIDVKEMQIINDKRSKEKNA